MEGSLSHLSELFLRFRRGGAEAPGRVSLVVALELLRRRVRGCVRVLFARIVSLGQEIKPWKELRTRSSDNITIGSVGVSHLCKLVMDHNFLV